jgi:hypothetical protein
MAPADQTLYMDEVTMISEYRTEKDGNGIGRV